MYLSPSLIRINTVHTYIHIYNIYTEVYLMLTLACGQIGKWYGPLYGEAIGGVDDIVQYILKPSVVHTLYCVSIFFNKNETSSCLIEPVGWKIRRI